MIENPYYREAYLKKELSFTEVFTIRHAFIEKYGFAIPSQSALDIITAFSPIVEFGAGSGYWASLLKKNGCEIEACDNFSGRYFDTEKHWEKYFDVKDVDLNYLSKCKKHTLLLCWPDYLTDMAFDCVKSFKGDYVIFIGESYGGCTANDAFFEYLDKYFKLDYNHPIPQFISIHDSLYIYRRNFKFKNKKFKSIRKILSNDHFTVGSWT